MYFFYSIMLIFACVINTAFSGASVLSVSTSSVKAALGESVTVSCVSSSETVFWTDPDDRIIGRSNETNVYSYFEDGNLRLVIKKIKSENEGTFICHDAFFSSRNASFALRISGLPIFEEHFESINVRKGSNVTLHCNASGDPPPEYIWLDPNSVEITTDYGDENSDLKEAKSSYLYIYNVTEKSNGYYTCKASNSHGMDSKIFEVVVRVNESGDFPPVFKNAFEKFYKLPKDSIALICEAKAMPPPSYVWYKDGYDMKINNRTLIERFDDSSILNITSLQPGDGGNYTCEARNYLGEARKIFDIFLANSTEPLDDGTIIYKAVREVTHTNVTFDLIAKNMEIFDGFKTMYSYKVFSGMRTGSVSWEFGERYTVKSLIPGTTYFFKFSVYPTNSSNAWSDEMNVTLPLLPPEIIFRTIYDRKVNIEIFRSVSSITSEAIDHYRITYKPISMIRGETWDLSSKCEVSIVIHPSCTGRNYEVSGLSKSVYYVFMVQSHNVLGYSAPTSFKVYFVD